MIFLAILVFFPLLFFTPWWALAAFTAFCGFFFANQSKVCMKIGVGAAVSGIAVALIRDGMSDGQISKRFSALFGLGETYKLYLVVAAMIFLTAWLCAHSGRTLRILFSASSAPPRAQA